LVILSTIEETVCFQDSQMNVCLPLLHGWMHMTTAQTLTSLFPIMTPTLPWHYVCIWSHEVKQCILLFSCYFTSHIFQGIDFGSRTGVLVSVTA